MATKTFTITLDEGLMKNVDLLIKQKMVNHSEYFRRLALTDLSRREALSAILDAGNKKGSL